MHHRPPFARAAACAALAWIAVLAACSDKATTAPQPSATFADDMPTIVAGTDASPQDDAASQLGRFPTRIDVMARRAVDSLRGASPQTFADVSSSALLPITYHGGPVMFGANKIVSIYWGPNTIYTNGPTPGTTGSGNNDFSLIGYFLRNIGQTPYWKINQEYRDAQGRGVPNALYYTTFWANPTNPGVSPDGAAIRAMITSGFYTKYAPDQNTIYLVFAGPGVNLGGGFGGSGYCAYHNRFRYVNGPFVFIIKYAVMPYDASKSECTSDLIANKSPNPDHGADVEVSALAHELEETVTDPELNAWYDAHKPKGEENADKCAWTFGSTYTTANGAKANIRVGVKDFLIQQNWRIGNMVTQFGCRMS